MITINPGNINVVADSTGSYTIDDMCAGSYHILCSRIGFKTEDKNILLQNDTVLFHHITFDPTFFRSVEIESQKSQITEGAGIRNISSDQLRIKSGLSLSEKLESVAGISSLKTGNNIVKPIIHGLHSSRILFFNNGIRHEGQQWGSEHAPEIDPELAEKITVAMGASGMRYGHDVIGGVVLVEPADNRRTPGVNGEINSTWMSNGRTISTSGKVQMNFKKIKPLGMMFQGSIHRGGNISTPDKTLDNTGQQRLNYAVGINYNKSRFGLQLFYSLFDADVGIYSGSHTGNLTDLNNIISGKTTLTDSDFTYQIDRPKQHMLHELHKARLYWITGINSKLEVLYARQYNLREEFDKHLPRNDSLAALDKPELQLEITTHSSDLNWSIKKGSAHNLHIGLRGVYQANTYEGRFVIPNFERYSGGAFLLYQWQNKSTNIETCIRYDNNQLHIYRYVNYVITDTIHYTGDYSATISLDQKVNEKISVGINLGRSWRAMQANELYSDGLHHGSASYERGNKSLREEISYNTNGRIFYKDKHSEIEINPYAQIIENFTYLLPELPPILTIRGVFPTFIYTQKNALLFGVDVAGKIRIPHGLLITAKSSILRAKQITTGDFISQMPSDRYEIQARKEIESLRKLSDGFISVGAIYVNRQWRTGDDLDYLEAPSPYTLIQASIGFSVKTENTTWMLAFSADNLFDTTYRDYLNRFRYYADEQGKNFTLRITYLFNKTNSKDNEKK